MRTAHAPTLHAGLDFETDVEKLWLLDTPLTNMDIQDLLWHLSLPLHTDDDGYNYTSRDILDSPDAYRDDYARMLEADLDYPISVMHHQGRWLVLDGMFRLMKAYVFKRSSVDVRIIPRDRLIEILK